MKKSYIESYTLAREELLRNNILDCCRNTGAIITKEFENTIILKIKFLNRTVKIEIPAFTFVDESAEEIDVWEKIIILHHLTKAEGTSLKNTLINFKQLSSGNQYFSAFEKRSIIPLVNFFGKKPERLIESSKIFGGIKVSLGDLAVKIMAFPWVPIFLILWRGDQEFPPQGSILFDASINQKLSAEDIAVLCQQLVFKMQNSPRESS